VAIGRLHIMKKNVNVVVGFVLVGLFLAPSGAHAQFGGWNPVQDIKREVENGAQAVSAGANHLAGEAKKEVQKGKVAAVNAGVPAEVVETLTAPATGTTNMANDLAHGNLPKPVDVLRSSPEIGPGLTAVVIGVNRIKTFADSVQKAIEEGTKAAQESQSTLQKATDFLAAFSAALLGDGGMMAALTLFVWLLAVYLELAIIVRVKGILFPGKQNRVVVKRRAAYY
jgi:hypothetical protein